MSGKKQETPIEPKVESKRPEIKISKLQSKSSIESASSPAIGNVNMLATKKVKLASEMKPLK